MFRVKVSCDEFSHFCTRQIADPKHDWVVVLHQVRNIDICVQNQADGNRWAEVPYAGQRGLDHELVSSVAASYKTKWSLHFHVARADASAETVSVPWKHSRYTRAKAAANNSLALRVATSLLAVLPSLRRSSSRLRNVSIALLNPAASRISQRIPPSRSTTASGTPPVRNATTGVPQLIASISANP